jgi:hypothetical protein
MYRKGANGMKLKSISSRKQNKDVIGVFAVTGALLLIPLIAMQFTTEVDWDLRDFIIMGILLSGTGILIILATSKLRDSTHRAFAILGLLIVFLLIWAELAVGVFGSPFAGS